MASVPFFIRRGTGPDSVFEATAHVYSKSPFSNSGLPCYIIQETRRKKNSKVEFRQCRIERTSTNPLTYHVWYDMMENEDTVLCSWDNVAEYNFDELQDDYAGTIASFLESNGNNVDKEEEFLIKMTAAQALQNFFNRMGWKFTKKNGSLCDMPEDPFQRLLLYVKCEYDDINIMGRSRCLSLNKSYYGRYDFNRLLSRMFLPSATTPTVSKCVTP